MLKWFLTLFFLPLVLFSCASAPVTPENSAAWNRELSERTFTALMDLPSEHFAGTEAGRQPLYFKKGEKIRIWTEAGSDWFRVKGYSAKESREQAQGRIILYVFFEEILSSKPKEDAAEDSAYFIQQISSRLEQMLKSEDGKPVIQASP